MSCEKTRGDCMGDNAKLAKSNPFTLVKQNNDVSLLTEADQNELAAAEKAFNKKVPFPIKVGLVAFLVIIFIISFALGRYPISPIELPGLLWYGFTDLLNDAVNNFLYSIEWLVYQVSGTVIELGRVQISDPNFITEDNLNKYTALINIRMPRVAAVMLVGASLAVAGASYQGMFKNPLVSPDILGASAGASFGACLALLLDQPNYMVQIAAFTGGMVAVGMAVWLNHLVRYDAILGLVLGGILISTLFESGSSLIKLVADADDKLPAITFWLMGSFADVQDGDFWAVIIPMIFGFVLLMIERWKLNVLSFGDEEARAMGINTRRVRFVVIFASTLVVSLSVAVAGLVGWVGLVIPHLARAVVGPNYRVLLPASMFLGASYLLIVDNIARLVAPIEIPIGILTAILGVPFFVFIFKHNMRGWN